ncbi:MAG: hypothetical protein AAGG53_15025 [Cyanobacteria bacterium P01_H01_bin.152]
MARRLVLAELATAICSVSKIYQGLDYPFSGDCLLASSGGEP